MSTILTNVTTIEEMAEVLQDAGFETEVNGDSVFTKIGVRSPFPVVITLDSEEKEFEFDCQVALVSNVPESNQTAMLAALLKLNAEIQPFAFAIPTEEDEDDAPIVLVDSIPIGDLSSREVIITMEKLQLALTKSRTTMQSLLSA